MDINKLQEGFTQEGYIYLPGFMGFEKVETINNKLGELIRKSLPHMPPHHVNLLSESVVGKTIEYWNKSKVQ